jgi:16S rRNA (uracil1498-N3)-methyltransferase
MPQLRSPVAFDRLRGRFNEYDLVVAAEPAASRSIGPALDTFFKGKGKRLLLLVGPEGGFSSQERDVLGSEKSVSLVRLADHTLRSETAAIFLAGLATHYMTGRR